MLVKLYSREFIILLLHISCIEVWHGLQRVRQGRGEKVCLGFGSSRWTREPSRLAVYISVLVGLVRLNADHSPSFSPAVNSPYPSSKQDRVPKTAQVNYEASR